MKNAANTRLIVAADGSECRAFKKCRSQPTDLRRKCAPVQVCHPRSQHKNSTMNLHSHRKPVHCVNFSPHMKAACAHHRQYGSSCPLRLLMSRLWAASSRPGAHPLPHPCTASSPSRPTDCASRTSDHTTSPTFPAPPHGPSPFCSLSTRCRPRPRPPPQAPLLSKVPVPRKHARTA